MHIFLHYGAVVMQEKYAELAVLTFLVVNYTSDLVKQYLLSPVASEFIVLVWFVRLYGNGMLEDN